MTFKLPSNPSSHAYKEETADFWEIEAIRNRHNYVSQRNILCIISKELDEIRHDGIESEDDVLDSRLEEVFKDLDNRIVFTRGKYPFELSFNSIRNKEFNTSNDWIYIFLLLCTRLNMKDEKHQGGIDGTLLFERICEQVIINFFGDQAESELFGTSVPGNFETKVSQLIIKLGEGNSFKNPDKNRPTKNDDSIDIVAWKKFSDKRMGKLIAFCQCKTGTNWREHIYKLRPRVFCDRWFHESPVLDPVPIVFITDTMNEEFNFFQSQQGFLIFNRFRIMEYLPEGLPENLIKDVRQWVESALDKI